MDMTITSELQQAANQGEGFMLLPFSALYLSKENVRKTPGKMPIPDLAESIYQHGLKQNLIVEQKAGKKKGQTHGVIGGGRRFQAMALLVKDGRWTKDRLVPVLVEAGENATAVSLIENIAREGMHPADELDAWIKMSSEGKSIETISHTFGVSQMTVRRRLKLTTVSPKLLALLRTDEISLEQLAALSLANSHAVQEDTWFSASQSWQRSPDQIRARLTTGEIDPTTDNVARFVGLAAYEAAGGHVHRDLFSDQENGGYITDAELLHRLCDEKLQGVADRLLAAGWSWVEVRHEYNYSEFRSYGRLDADFDSCNTEVAAALRELETKKAEIASELSALNEKDIDEDDERIVDLEDRASALDAEIKFLRDSGRAWTPEQLAAGGAVVCLDYDGYLEVRFGLVRPTAAVPVGADGAAMKVTNSYGQPFTPKVKATHSDSLVRHLTAHRTAATQLALAKRVDAALALLTFRLAQEVLEPHAMTVESALQVRGTVVSHQLQQAADDLKDSPAWKALQSQRTEWRCRMPEKVRDWFQWLLQQDQEVVLQLLTFCVALHTDGLRSTEAEASKLDMVVDVLGVDMADYWTATANGYFSRVSKAQIAATVAEAVSEEAAAPLANMKKGAAAIEAERLIAGVRWVPEPMRNRPVQPVRGTADNDNEGDDEMADEGYDE